VQRERSEGSAMARDCGNAEIKLLVTNQLKKSNEREINNREKTLT
jgi:hypothetical protein